MVVVLLREFREYLFSPMPAGEMTHPWGRFTTFLQVNFFFTVTLPLCWIMVNVPELSGLTLIYLVLALWGELIAFSERIMPEKVPWAYIAIGTEALPYQVLTAFAVTALVTSLGGATEACVPFTITSEEPLALYKLYLWLYAFVAVEESLFGQWLSASAVEKLGIVPGASLSGFVFTIFHWRIYGWLPPILLGLFLFRFITTVAMGIFKSIIPAALSHFLNNFLAVRALGVLPV